MTQMRDERFPPETASDPNLSKPDGTFCIPYISPGKYLLTAEKTDFDSEIRWIGYYPGVGKHAEAVPIEIHAGENLRDLHFTVNEEHLFTACVRIATPDGSEPLDRLGVSIDSLDRDALAYHETQNNNEHGVYCLGYVPPGRYVVQTYIQLDFETEKVPVELSKWQMAKQEVDIKAASEIILRLKPAN